MAEHGATASSSTSSPQHRDNDRILNIGPGLEQGTIGNLTNAESASRRAAVEAGNRNSSLPIIGDVSGQNADYERECAEDCEMTLRNLHEAWRDVANYQDLMADELSDEQLAALQKTARDIADAERDCAQVLKTIDPDNKYFDPSNSSMRDYHPDQVDALSTPPDWGNIAHRLDYVIPNEVEGIREDFQTGFDGLARNIYEQKHPDGLKPKDSSELQDASVRAGILAGSSAVASAAEMLHDPSEAENDLDDAVSATTKSVGDIIGKFPDIVENAKGDQPEL